MDDCAEASLVLHNDVWDAHLAAESGEVDDEFDGVDVIGDHDQAGTLRLDEADAVVETELDVEGSLGVLRPEKSVTHHAW